jgi:hypothetical protein
VEARRSVALDHEPAAAGRRQGGTIDRATARLRRSRKVALSAVLLEWHEIQCRSTAAGVSAALVAL